MRTCERTERFQQFPVLLEKY